MNFYNESTKEILTASQLVIMGYATSESALNLEQLKKLSIYPVEYKYPAVPDTYLMVPDKLTKVNDHYERAFKLKDAPLEVAKNQLISKVADLRWQTETGGIDFYGNRISTDRQSQAMITQTVAGINLVNTADPDKITSVKFKSDSGFVELTPEQIAAIGIAVTLHVEKCYTREAELVAKIKAATSLKKLRAININFDFAEE